MKKIFSIFSLIFATLLVMSCNFTFQGKDVKFIEPSSVVVTEERPVSGFHAIEMGTFGEVIITQGDTESLTIKGSDNIVPLVKTTVRGGALVISMEENVNITGMTRDNMLTFTIMVKDLTGLSVSGAGKVSMESLDTSDLDVVMSGAGDVQLGSLKADALDINISGVGNVGAAGEATSAKVNISGAGSFQAPDLKLQTADITISGIGGAEVWVTDSLSGNISGAGGVKYYGSPTVDTTTSGVGNFESLGDK